MRFSDFFSLGRTHVGTWDALECPKCKAVYRIPADASIAMWEQVLETASGGGSSSIFDSFVLSAYGDTQAGRHDSIKAMPNWADMASKARANTTFLNVKMAVMKGHKRRWTCAKCKNTAIPYPKD
jgi:hypothetical protein